MVAWKKPITFLLGVLVCFVLCLNPVRVRGQSFIRFGDSCVGCGLLGLYSDGEFLPGTQLSVGALSDYTAISSGNHNLSIVVQSSGVVLVSLIAGLKQDQYYTAVALGKFPEMYVYEEPYVASLAQDQIAFELTYLDPNGPSEITAEVDGDYPHHFGYYVQYPGRSAEVILSQSEPETRYDIYIYDNKGNRLASSFGDYLYANGTYNIIVLSGEDRPSVFVTENPLSFY